MKILEVIPARQWQNKKTGNTASVYGSIPYTNESGKNDWTIEIVGYTWRLTNGTIGLGRIPAKTENEAIAVMNEINNRGKI